MIYDVIVIGGGAAGVFAAIAAKNTNPLLSVLLLEKTGTMLSKVRISGGGRCNVTHACFEPALLVKNYPRGEKELLGPFHRFQPRDTLEWFQSRGTPLKTEEDGRMFPVTDRSETIIDTLLTEAKRLNITIRLKTSVLNIKKEPNSFLLTLAEETLSCKNLILTTGSHPQGFQWAQHLGHTIVPPVPSLFTFNVPSSPLKELSGVAVEKVSLHLPGFAYRQAGPLLITHFGFSGPAVLKLSAWGARFLHEHQYRQELIINWLPGSSESATVDLLTSLKENASQKTLLSENPFKFPKNLWKVFLASTLGELSQEPLAKISLKLLRSLAQRLHHDPYLIEGKTTHKEEFVTCGGVLLKEIHFKTMESKECPHLFFAGEILNIDGVTGGFNFQNAWTTGFIAGSSAAVS